MRKPEPLATAIVVAVAIKWVSILVLLTLAVIGACCLLSQVVTVAVR